MKDDVNNLSEDAERLLQLVIGDGSCEQVSRLAREIVEKRESARRANKMVMLDEFKSRLAKYEMDNDNDDFLEDGTLGQIWGKALSANSDALKFQELVLSQWSSPYQKALKKCREAIELLCARWGFGQDVWAMLHFIFVEFNQYRPDDQNVSSSMFLDFEYDPSGVEGILFMGGKLSNKEIDDGDGIDIRNIQAKIEHAAEEVDRQQGDNSGYNARCAVFGEDAYGGDEIQTAICDAIYICFYPNALCWLSDAEFVLWVLIGFLNGATNNDASVRYARLKKRIQELEKEVNNIGGGEQPSMQPSNDNNDGKLESINILNDYSVQ